MIVETHAPPHPRVAVPMLAFPTHYLVAPGASGHYTVFPLETVPPAPFEAWLSAFLESTPGFADPVLLTVLAGFDHTAWPKIQRWWVVNEIAERLGPGRVRPWYTERWMAENEARHRNQEKERRS